MSSNFEAVVCLATFRRPKMLLDALRSLEKQETSILFSVVIIDNDAEHREGLIAATQFLKTSKLNATIFVEPEQGNVFALNRAFHEALNLHTGAQFFLMMDDDEIASPLWLDKMVNASKEYNAEIVGGPVFPQFEIINQRAMHPAFVPAYQKSGYVPRIYGSGNCLITRNVFTKFSTKPLDTTFNFLGGADTDFFARTMHAGFTSYWANEADITETVPASRLRTEWLIERGLRIGSLNVLVEQKSKSWSYITAKSFAVLPLYIYFGFKSLIKGNHWLIAAHPVMIAFGRFLAHFNRLPTPYKA